MRRNNLFWGLLLIILGGLFYLKTTGLITDVFGWFWPLVLILLGVWVLTQRFVHTRGGIEEPFSIDLQSAARLDLNIDHGAGSISLRGGAPAGVAVYGTSGTTLEVEHAMDGQNLGVELKAGPTFIPFLGPEGGEWQFTLTNEVPVAISFEGGASNMDLDMTGVKLTFLGIQVGASKIKVRLPAGAGHTLVDIEAGAASVDLSVPEGVAARIRLDHGASTVNIDEKRFPRLTSMQNMYESAGFATSPDQVEISMEGGASSLTVR